MSKPSSVKQCLKKQNAHTTNVVSSHRYRINLGTASKDSSLRITRQMTEEKGREDQRASEKLDNNSMKKENSPRRQSTSCKYSVQIEHCAFKPLRRESEKALKKECGKEICMCDRKEEVFPTTSKVLKIIDCRPQKQCDFKKVKLEKENKQTMKCEINASQSAIIEHSLCSEEGNGSTNQIGFSKQAVTVQTLDVCSSKPGVTTPLKSQNKTPSSEKQLSQIMKESCKTGIALSQASSEKNQISPAKSTITQTSPDKTFLSETEDQNETPEITLTPPITTTPIRSGLRLLSIVSTRSAPNVPDSPAITTETPKLPDRPTTAKTNTTAKTVQAGERSPITTSGTPKTIEMTTPSTVQAPQSPTLLNVISTSKPVITTQENKPSSTGLPVTVTPPQIPTNVAASILPSPAIQHQTDTPGPPPTSQPFCSPLTTPPWKAIDSTKKCQSEPTFKAWITPPDSDPMSQTFLRMPFTYQSLQVECSHGNRPHVKRPMNAFMVWAKKNRASIAKRFPNASNAEISVRLGHIWNELPSIEQKPYFDEANELKERHKHDNPNWVYQPRPGKKCRKALFVSASSRSQPTSPVARKIIAKSHDLLTHPPRSAPSSPNVKRPLWLARKTELSENELQSRIVEDLLDNEIHEDAGTGNPTMDKYIDEWLSPKRSRRERNDLCLMNDAMLPAVNDYEQDILEEETRCDGKDFEKYIKQLKKERNNFTKLENNISNLEDDENECHG